MEKEQAQALIKQKELEMKRAEEEAQLNQKM